MEYTTLGETGTTVSRLGLGCMSFGSPEWRDWVLGEAESAEIIERAIDLGVTFFDTANAYSMGESERILGEVLAEYDRDRHVVATKVFFPMRPDDPNSGGLSRKTIEQELAHSLERLGMDAVDLYQIHRMDPETPIEETLRALDDAVRRGQVRYVGASSMWAHEFADALHASERLGVERFATMQNHYNLAYREEEREMLPLCAKAGVGVVSYSPLARGFLARPHEAMRETARGEHVSDSDRFSSLLGTYRANGGVEVNERVEELAEELDATMAQVALAWLLHQEPVDTVLVGTSSVEHLEDAVEALELDLSESDLDYLEEPYEPVPVAGHR